jgi:hypothetical protein
MNRSIRCRAALAVLFLSGALGARAELTNCTPVTSVPTTITAPGAYCFTGNLTLASTGVAIHVLGTRDVVLDLNGHALMGPSNGTGILVEGTSRVTVRNGSIVHFRRGAYVAQDCFRATLEDLQMAVTGELPAIESRAWGDVIRRNWIERGSPGILVHGYASHISDNKLLFSTAGIDAAGSSVTIEDNGVHRVSAVSTFGIRTGDGRAFVSRNNVSGFPTCFEMGTRTRYRENVTLDCANTYTGGVSAGSNY